MPAITFDKSPQRVIALNFCSSSVSSAPGAELISAAKAADTKAVVANCVVLVPGDAVGPAGMPEEIVGKIAQANRLAMAAPAGQAIGADRVELAAGGEDKDLVRGLGVEGELELVALVADPSKLADSIPLRLVHLTGVQFDGIRNAAYVSHHGSPHCRCYR